MHTGGKAHCGTPMSSHIIVSHYHRIPIYMLLLYNCEAYPDGDEWEHNLPAFRVFILNKLQDLDLDRSTSHYPTLGNLTHLIYILETSVGHWERLNFCAPEFFPSEQQARQRVNQDCIHSDLISTHSRYDIGELINTRYTHEYKRHAHALVNTRNTATNFHAVELMKTKTYLYSESYTP
jgi:hypothetical protein